LDQSLKLGDNDYPDDSKDRDYDETVQECKSTPPFFCDQHKSQ
jgi:hypothetical protein